MVSEFNYVLTRELKYSREGDPNTVAEFITLKEPTAANFKEAARIRQCIKKAMMAAIDASAAEASEGPPPEDAEDEAMDPKVLMMILSTHGDRMDAFFDDVREVIMSKGTALIDGDTALTKSVGGRIPMADMESMIFEYVSRFFMG